jgi:hypothetical protein
MTESIRDPAVSESEQATAAALEPAVQVADGLPAYFPAPDEFYGAEARKEQEEQVAKDRAARRLYWRRTGIAVLAIAALTAVLAASVKGLELASSRRTAGNSASDPNYALPDLDARMKAQIDSRFTYERRTLNSSSAMTLQQSRFMGLLTEKNPSKSPILQEIAKGKYPRFGLLFDYLDYLDATDQDEHARAAIAFLFASQEWKESEGELASYVENRFLEPIAEYVKLGSVADASRAARKISAWLRDVDTTPEEDQTYTSLARVMSRVSLLDALFERPHLALQFWGDARRVALWINPRPAWKASKDEKQQDQRGLKFLHEWQDYIEGITALNGGAHEYSKKQFQEVIQATRSRKLHDLATLAKGRVVFWSVRKSPNKYHPTAISRASEELAQIRQQLVLQRFKTDIDFYLAELRRP